MGHVHIFFQRRRGDNNLGGPIDPTRAAEYRKSPYFLVPPEGPVQRVASWSAAKRRVRALLAAGAFQVTYAEGSTWSLPEAPSREQIYSQARRGRGGRFTLGGRGQLVRSKVE